MANQAQNPKPKAGYGTVFPLSFGIRHFLGIQALGFIMDMDNTLIQENQSLYSQNIF
jgi:predicted HAD superfamily phosphohydrolase YqeG